MDPVGQQNSTTPNVAAPLSTPEKIVGNTVTSKMDGTTTSQTSTESGEMKQAKINETVETPVAEDKDGSATVNKDAENTVINDAESTVNSDAQQTVTKDTDKTVTKDADNTDKNTVATPPVNMDAKLPAGEKPVEEETTNENQNNNSESVEGKNQTTEAKEENNDMEVEEKETTTATDASKVKETGTTENVAAEITTKEADTMDVDSDEKKTEDKKEATNDAKDEENMDESNNINKQTANDPPQASQVNHETVPDESPSAQNTTETTNSETPANNSSTTTTSQPAPKTVILRPALRGHLKMMDGIATWEGLWGMDDNAFNPGGFTSPFKYAWTKDAVPATAPGAAGEPDGGKSLPMNLKDSYFSGHFIMGATTPGVPPSKIEEKNLLFKFRSSEADPDIIIVEGTGRNKFGSFQLDGTFDSTSKELNVHRTYATKSKSSSRQRSRKPPVKKAATPGVPPPPRSATTTNIPRGLSTGDIVFHARRTERVRRAPTHLSEDDAAKPLSKISRLVHQMLQQDKEKYFSAPVDPVKLNIPEYTKIITNPMDLGTISNNLADKIYEDEEQVVEHVRLTYKNAMRFNPKTHALHSLAKQYLESFDKNYQRVKKEREREEAKFRRKGSKGGAPAYVPPAKTSKSSKKRKAAKGKKAKKSKKRSKAVFSDSDTDSSDESGESEVSDSSDSDSDSDSSSDEDTRKRKRKKSKRRKAVKRKKQNEEQEKLLALQAELSQLKQQVKTLKSQPKPVVHHHVTAPVQHVAPVQKVKKKRNSRPLSYQDKRQLVADIHKLPSDQIQRVLNIISETGAPLGGDGEEVELDFDLLDTTALRRIQRFVRGCLTKEKQKMHTGEIDD